MMTKRASVHSLKKIEQLFASSQTIFTVQDLSVIWQVTDKTSLYSSIQYYLRVGRLKKVHKGIYALSEKEYISFELAQKLICPSYISFYTALAVHGIIFQLYSAVHSVALKSKQLEVNQEKFTYHQLKEVVFYDSTGIEDKTTHLMAGPERAICDSLYLASGLSFDSLDTINLDFLSQVSKIYGNKRLEEKVAKMIELEKK